MNRSQRIKSVLAVLVLGASAACISTQLEVAAADAADPRAATAPLPEIEAFAAPAALASPPAGPAGTADPHAGHQHGAEAPAAAPPAATAAPTASPANDEQPQPAQWTCPMHPEVVKPEPGKCPICGMNLVPKKPEPKEPGKGAR